MKRPPDNERTFQFSIAEGLGGGGGAGGPLGGGDYVQAVAPRNNQ